MTTTTFGDPRRKVTNADLRDLIGRSYLPIEEVLSLLQTEFQSISCEWKFSKNSGWYIVYNRGKKRLFYLFPEDGDFQFKLVLNDRALGRIREEAFPKYIRDMIQNASKYPEGTLCQFNKSNFKVDRVIQLLRIKIQT